MAVVQRVSPSASDGRCCVGVDMYDTAGRLAAPLCILDHEVLYDVERIGQQVK